MGDICVSVIIPVYNAERHLEECLNSCLKQTLREIEIICVNDGSTDNTGTILERYSDQYPNIIIMNQENQGAGAARNLGMRFARGEFISFMDSDDFYPNQEALWKLYTSAIEKKVYVCGGTAFFMNDGKVDENDTALSFSEAAILHFRENQRIGGFTRFIYDRQFLLEEKIQFPTWRWYEDQPFFAEVMAKAERLYAIRDLVYVIRNTDKIVQFHNDDIVIGILNGIGSMLRISRENRFAMLHADRVVDLNENFAACIYERIYHRRTHIRECYERVITGIDESLLEEDIRKLKKPEAPSEGEIAQIFEDSLKREQALLDKVNLYEKVLIYGAGRAGRLLYQYLRQRGCKKDIDFMITAKHSDYTACGKKVYSIQECTDEKDRALVIIANMSHIEQMKETAHYYQFKHIEAVSWNELMFFGADMTDEDYLTIF